MIYLNSFSFPTLEEQYRFLHPKDLTPEEVAMGVGVDRRAQYSKESTYPFGVLPEFKDDCYFNDITILYGSNGCGKTTVLNVIAEKLHLKREGQFNTGAFFGDYLAKCSYYTNFAAEYDENYTIECEYKNQAGYIPQNSRFIASDDVFSKIFDTREYNSGRHLNNAEMVMNYDQEIAASERNIDRMFLSSRRSAFLKKHKEEERREYSNGENALICFTENMEKEGLYLLDEPENSLSIENQKFLSTFIETQARFHKCQFIIATHSPFISGIDSARIYSFENGYIERKKWQELSGIRETYEFFKENEARFT